MSGADPTLTQTTPDPVLTRGSRGRRILDIPQTIDPKPVKLWLWRDGDHFLAFDNEYPTFDGGDPMVLGEPVGYAILTPSTPGIKHDRA